MSKTVFFDKQVRDAISDGADIIGKVVGSTMGSKGRNVAIERLFSTPIITNDGVSIVREMELSDRMQNIAASVLRDIATKTNEDAGDGTTTSIVLASDMICSGCARINMGTNPVAIRRGMEMACADAIAYIKKSYVFDLEEGDIDALATVSSESPYIGKMIGDAYRSVGKDGIVMVEADQNQSTINVAFSKGFEFDRGLFSPQFIDDQGSGTTSLSNVAVFLVNDNIEKVDEIAHLAKLCIEKDRTSAVIIANGFSADVINIMIANRVQNKFKFFPVRSPGFADGKLELFKDIQSVVGGDILGGAIPTTGAIYGAFGVADSLIVSMSSTTIVATGSGVEARLATLRAQVPDAKSKYDTQKLQARIARLAGGVCIIKVGAETDTEIVYLKDKIDDAVFAVKNALVDGYTVGGGTTYYNVAKILRHSIHEKGLTQMELVGYEIVLDAMMRPIKQIIENAGGEVQDILEKISLVVSNTTGYNSDNGMIEDLQTARIIDSASCTINALKNAVSAGSILLTTSAILIEDFKAPKNKSDDEE